MQSDLPHLDKSSLSRLSQSQNVLEDFEELVRFHRDKLRRMVAMRLDQALQKRIDASDVVQDALMTAFARLQDYLARRPMSFELWLRKTTLERLVDLRRQHYASQRNVRCEVTVSDHSALLLAERVMGQSLSGPEQAIRREKMQLVRSAIDSLDHLDRELLLLRYADNLSLADAAQMLDIEPSAASKRHGRALLKLADRLRRVGLRDA